MRLFERIRNASDVGVVERRLTIGEEALTRAVVESVEEFNNNRRFCLFAR